MSRSALYTYLPDGEPPAPWHGWTAQPSFGDPEAELDAALNGRACVDSSPSGRIEVSGRDRVDLLHRLSTNALAHLQRGSAAPTVFLTDKGRIIDRVLVCATDETLLLLTSPGAEAFLTGWIGKYTITEDVTLREVTASTVMASLIGAEMISGFCSGLGCPVPAAGEVSRCAALMLVRESPPDLLHVVAPAGEARALAEAVGRHAPGARWIGFRAYDAFRIAGGIPARPGELSSAHNPLECGLRPAVSFTKGCYIGQEVIARLDTYSREKHALAGLAFSRPPSGALPLSLTKNGAAAGTLTSVSSVPHHGAFAALGILRADAAAAGDTLLAGEERAEARVTRYFPQGTRG